MSAVIDLTGQKFGVLRVLSRISSRSGRACFSCQCECGNKIDVVGQHLRRGAVTSCGCKKVERAKKNAINFVTHGKTNSPEFRTWTQMISRCTNKNDYRYPRYGGRGITVDERWLESFEAFLEDVGRRPNPTDELDRIENDGNYEPGNVRWVSAKVNCNNRSSNRLITYNGRTQSMTLWAEEMGLEPATLRVRLESNWGVERALTQPVRRIARWSKLKSEGEA